MRAQSKTSTWSRSPRPGPRLLLTCAFALLTVSHRAQAQFAVIDVASLTQLIGQAQTMAQQLAALRAELGQAQLLYQSMTGSRGMQQLLNVDGLNYLPMSWPQLMDAMQADSVPYRALSDGVGAALAANSVLSAPQLAALAPDEQASIAGARRSVALVEGLAQQALANSSARFEDIQRLATAIPAASDQKAALELQAAIGAELALLQNEQTKLQVVFEAAQATERSNRQRMRELVIAGHGSFAARFEPTPP